MDPWLHQIPKSLQARHLCSPVIEFECDPDEPAVLVADRVKEQLAADRTSKEIPAPRRATIILGNRGAFVHFAVMDDLLNNQGTLQQAKENDLSVSFYSRKGSLDTAIDGETNFVVALRRFHELNRPNPTAEIDVARDDVQLIVLDRGRVFGAIREENFVTVPVRVAILSLLLELEEAVVSRVLREDPIGWRNCLSPARVLQAETRASQKRIRIDPPTDRSVLNSTQFCDKLVILKKKGWGNSQKSASQLRSGLSQLEDVRNWCAHTGDGWNDPNTGTLIEVIDSARQIVTDLHAGYQ